MNISCEPRNIRILSSNGNRLATASITIDGAFVVRNLSLMNGSKGMFVNMPQQKGVDDKGNTKYYDIAFPLTAELRTAISEAVIGAYKERCLLYTSRGRKYIRSPRCRIAFQNMFPTTVYRSFCLLYTSRCV